jgi:biopolymer transport protein ExbD
MKRRWRKNHLGAPAEVNITAFMNLMVILVPFLLITAVFSRITILDLNVPTPGAPEKAQAADEAEELQLEVIVRQSMIEVSDRRRGLLKQIPVSGDDSDLKALSDLLLEIKARHPDKQDITLLLEKEISYERVVEMMDTLRVAPVEQDGMPLMAELFPAISMGDAPLMSATNPERNAE